MARANEVKLTREPPDCKPEVALTGFAAATQVLLEIKTQFEVQERQPPHETYQAENDALAQANPLTTEGHKSNDTDL